MKPRFVKGDDHDYATQATGLLLPVDPQVAGSAATGQYQSDHLRGDAAPQEIPSRAGDRRGTGTQGVPDAAAEAGNSSRMVPLGFCQSRAAAPASRPALPQSPRVGGEAFAPEPGAGVLTS